MSELRAEALNLIQIVPEEYLSNIIQYAKKFVKPEITSEKALQAFYKLRDEAKANGLQNMTLDEINAEIDATLIGIKSATITTSEITRVYDAATYGG